jgi:hypothetical protein
MEKIFNQKSLNYLHLNLNLHLWVLEIAESVANLLPVLLIPVANLSPVSLIPVVHLDLRISPRIFEKIRNDPTVILRACGKMIHEKN